MSNEITTEVLANAIDVTKEIVQIKEIGDEVELDIGDKLENYYIVNKAASDKDSQLNAMAIAPIVNGKPDYNNIGVVYAGTNMHNETGANGFGTAADAFGGNLSGEYQLAAKHGQKDGFQTTSFDDWGRSQFGTLTIDERQWLLAHPEMLRRYQNDSWARGSFRDNRYGTVASISGIGMGEHNTLSKYFDGDTLNLDRLAKDGIFAPGMTKEQVEKAAQKWAEKNGDKNPFTNDAAEAKNRMKEYLKIYGAYSIVDIDELKRLRKKLKASGGGLSGNEEIFLDDSQALLAVSTASQTMRNGLSAVIEIYQEAITEAEQVWTEGLQHARSIGTELNEAEIIEALASAGATEASVVTEPTTFYNEQITKAKQLGESFDRLASEIKSGIDKLVQSDKSLANQLG
ncbi:hypothetical protein [uncultured Enterococcus sp.]|uniref:hypothetical protein n=1 Tax=uncultured Enterococcus sp. TaxID=167972 RepID=UPI002AA738CD|nr:hypothetical protein [uncultured Enterococcus sp.]